MVDNSLLEQVLQLDVEARRELLRAVEDSLDRDDLPVEVLAEVDRRLERLAAGPSPDGMPVDDFLDLVRARRRA